MNRGNLRHGMSGTRTWRIWQGMKTRIRCKGHSCYHRYGGRGLDLDPRWMKFELFFADMGTCPDGMTLERIDNSRGYWPDNCRWATYIEQANNTRINRFISFRGELDTLANWGRRLNMPVTALRHRLDDGWPEEKIITTPVRKMTRRTP